MPQIILPSTTLLTATTTAAFMPCTLWRPAGTLILARTRWEIFQVNGLATCCPAYQIATHSDQPGATQTVDSAGYQSAVNVYYPTDFRNIRTDATAPLKSNMLVRFGFLVKLSAVGVLAFVTAGGVVEVMENT